MAYFNKYGCKILSLKHRKINLSMEIFVENINDLLDTHSKKSANKS